MFSFESVTAALSGAETTPGDSASDQRNAVAMDFPGLLANIADQPTPESPEIDLDLLLDIELGEILSAEIDTDENIRGDGLRFLFSFGSFDKTGGPVTVHVDPTTNDTVDVSLENQYYDDVPVQNLPLDLQLSLQSGVRKTVESYRNRANDTRTTLNVPVSQNPNNNTPDPLFGLPAHFDIDNLRTPSTHEPKAVAERVIVPQHSRLVAAVREALGLTPDDEVNSALYINHLAKPISGGLAESPLGVFIEGNAIVNFSEIEWAAKLNSDGSENTPSTLMRSLLEEVASNELWHANFQAQFSSDEHRVNFLQQTVDQDPELAKILQSRGLPRTGVYDGYDIDDAGSDRTSYGALSKLIPPSAEDAASQLDDEEIEGIRARLMINHSRTPNTGYDEIGIDLTRLSFENFFVHNAAQLDDETFAAVGITEAQFEAGKANWQGLVRDKLRAVEPHHPQVLLHYAQYLENTFADLTDAILEHLRNTGTIKTRGD